MNRIAWLAFGLCVTACGTRDVALFGALGDDTEYVAATFEDSNGTRVASTPLARLENTAYRIELESEGRDAARVRLYGWSIDSLAGFELVDDAFLDPVIYAEADAAVLPAPSFSGVRDIDASGPVEEDPGPEIGAPWLPPCPSLLPETNDNLADVRCLVRECAPAPVQRTCNVRLDLAGCGLALFEARVDGRGRFDAVSRYANACTTVIPTEPAIRSVDCDGCRIDFYSTPKDAPPFAQFEKFDLAPRELSSDIDSIVDGRLSSLVIIGDRLFVSALLDGPRRRSCGTTSRRSRIVEIDVVSRTVTSSVVLDGCFTRLVHDPAGPGFFALDFARYPRELVRFDANVREIGRLALPEFSANMQEVEMDAGELLAMDDPPQLLVTGNGEEPPSKVLFVGLSPLEVTTTLRLESRHLYALGVVNELVMAGQDGYIAVVDPRLRTVTDSLDLGTGDGIDKDPEYITYLPGPELIVSTSHSAKGGIVFASLSAEPSSGRYFETYGVPTAVAPIGTGESVLATVVDRSGSWATSLAIVDPGHARFLPGSVPLDAVGPVVNLVRDRTGAYWGSLSWDGQVFVVDLQ